MAIGNLDWTQRGGLLTLTERWGLTLAAIRKHVNLRLQARADGASRLANTLDRLGLRALEQVDHPWDALAFAASTAAQELQPQWLTNHCWRTYAWGTLLGLESRRTPQSRAGLYVHRLGFLDLIGQAPFDE